MALTTGNRSTREVSRSSRYYYSFYIATTILEYTVTTFSHRMVRIAAM